MGSEEENKLRGQCHLRLLLRYQTEIGTDSSQLLDQLAKGWAPGTSSLLPDSEAMLTAMEELYGNATYMEFFEAQRAECLHLGADVSIRIALNLSMDKFWPEIRIEVDRLLRTGESAWTKGQGHHC